MGVAPVRKNKGAGQFSGETYLCKALTMSPNNVLSIRQMKLISFNKIIKSIKHGL